MTLSNRLTNCFHRHGLFAASRFDCAQDERDERIIRELHLAQFDTPEHKAAVEEYWKKQANKDENQNQNQKRSSDRNNSNQCRGKSW